jgi:hypothetical protein
MNFIEQLPDSKGFTAILVVVDHFTKQALFILTHDTITSTQLAELFIIHVFSNRPWNNISEFIVTSKRITGILYYPLQNSAVSNPLLLRSS